jgi:hypothetical protein
MVQQTLSAVGTRAFNIGLCNTTARCGDQAAHMSRLSHSVVEIADCHHYFISERAALLIAGIAWILLVEGQRNQWEVISPLSTASPHGTQCGLGKCISQEPAQLLTNREQPTMAVVRSTCTARERGNGGRRVRTLAKNFHRLFTLRC